MSDENKRDPMESSQSNPDASTENSKELRPTKSLNRRDFAVGGITGLAAIAAGALVTHGEEAARLKSKILEQIKKDISSSKDLSAAAFAYDKGTVTHDRFQSFA